MRRPFHLSFVWVLSGALAGSALHADDLDAIKARGVLRHLGVPYANFVSGAGDGMEVEITQRFAKYLGVQYEYIATDWGTVVPDLLGRQVKVVGGQVTFQGSVPVKGDLIANGFTVLPWREKVVTFSEPTFPSQIWLIARSDSKVRPIKPTGTLEQDIAATRLLMKGRSVLSLEKTCLDPALYDLSATGARVICFKGNLNEMAPALLRKDAELTILDVPDALIALDKWRGRLKILGPITGKQVMGAAFPKDSPKLAEAYNQFLHQIQKDGTYRKIVLKYYPTAPRFFPEFFKSIP